MDHGYLLTFPKGRYSGPGVPSLAPGHFFLHFPLPPRSLNMAGLCRGMAAGEFEGFRFDAVLRR